MVRTPLRDKLNPPKTPETYVLDRTTSGFIKQVMMIIHPYYYDEDNCHYRGPFDDSLDISSFSHKILLEYYKQNQSFYLPAEGYFGDEQLFEELSKSKHKKFFELLDTMVWVLYNETRRGNGSYLSYCRLVDELNDSMRRNGIGYKIVEGELTIQTEPAVFERVTNPCLMALNQHGFNNADDFIMMAFEAYGEGGFKEAINNASNALENVLYELCQRKNKPVKKDDKIPVMLKALLEDEDLPNQIQEHHESFVKVMQTVSSIRNDRTAHGKEMKNVYSSMVRYTIDMACVDILFLVRLFCEEK